MNITAQKELAAQTPLRKQGFWLRVRKNWQLHLLMLLPVLYLILFYYTPMYGLQIAFKDFRTRAGIWGSEWVGFKHFEDFINGRLFGRLMGNTLRISIKSLIVTFPIPIAFALLLNEIKHMKVTGLTGNSDISKKGQCP